MSFRLPRLVFSLLVLAAASRMLDAADLERRTWVVDGVTREALVHFPAGAEKGDRPVVFAFHGHGGSMTQASRSFHFHQTWPEAIVVYPQGQPTPGALTDPKGTEAGWQNTAGGQSDRDLKFFDAMLADLRGKYRVDDKRIYATGHSNGGGFTYLLWAERGDVFAALAPSAAVLAHGYEKFKPKPVLHFASPEDPLVKFSWQARMIDRLLKLDGGGTRKPDTPGYVSYPSSMGMEVATYLHSGGHKYPDAAPDLIVKFFKAHPSK